jgi:hypothetical protein
MWYVRVQFGVVCLTDPVDEDEDVPEALHFVSFLALRFIM